MSKKKKEEAVENTEEVKAAAEAAQEEQPGEKDERDERIKALEEELAAGKDKYLRLAAEYDNFRKRTANEKLSLYDDATSKAVRELLPVADSVRMALDNLKEASPESFEKLKVEAFGAVGEDFDPNLHNAVGMVENEELGSGKIAAVYQTGYKLGDKIIRHAMVQVTS